MLGFRKLWIRNDPFTATYTMSFQTECPKTHDVFRVFLKVPRVRSRPLKVISQSSKGCVSASCLICFIKGCFIIFELFLQSLDS